MEQTSLFETVPDYTPMTPYSQAQAYTSYVELIKWFHEEKYNLHLKFSIAQYVNQLKDLLELEIKHAEPDTSPTDS